MSKFRYRPINKTAGMGMSYSKDDSYDKHDKNPKVIKAICGICGEAIPTKQVNKHRKRHHPKEYNTLKNCDAEIQKIQKAISAIDFLLTMIDVGDEGARLIKQIKKEARFIQSKIKSKKIDVQIKFKPKKT